MTEYTRYHKGGQDAKGLQCRLLYLDFDVFRNKKKAPVPSKSRRDGSDERRYSHHHNFDTLDIFPR